MTRPIRKVLVANRGEIALRIIRACRELGIESVLAHSEADAGSLPARSADRAICIGGASAAGSYLSKERIVGAAVALASTRSIPAMGFSPKMPIFAELCARAERHFHRTHAGIIRQMGDKIEARRIAKQAGVPTIPGSDGKVADPDEARRIVEAIGFPILVKASAGGGGRGMRVIENPAQLDRGLSEAMSEARRRFRRPVRLYREISHRHPPPGGAGARRRRNRYSSRRARLLLAAAQSEADRGSALLHRSMQQRARRLARRPSICAGASATLVQGRSNSCTTTSRRNSISSR